MTAPNLDEGKNFDMAKRKKRHDKPIRFRAARDDASIGPIQRNVESALKLPRGSVKLVYPSGRKVRVDSTVGVLRARWDE